MLLFSCVLTCLNKRTLQNEQQNTHRMKHEKRNSTTAENNNLTDASVIQCVSLMTFRRFWCWCITARIKLSKWFALVCSLQNWNVSHKISQTRVGHYVSEGVIKSANCRYSEKSVLVADFPKIPKPKKTESSWHIIKWTLIHLYMGWKWPSKLNTIYMEFSPILRAKPFQLAFTTFANETLVFT